MSLSVRQWAILTAGIGGAAALAQSRFRWRLDDGSESGASWDGAENAALTAAPGTRRLRAQVAATGDPVSSTFRLEYRKVGDTDWIPVE